MNKDLDLDKVWFVIRKSTPKRYDRAGAFRQKDGRYKIMFTSGDSQLGFDCLMAVLNHEFLHIILGEFVSTEYYGNPYDLLLKAFNRYNDVAMTGDWI